MEPYVHKGEDSAGSADFRDEDSCAASARLFATAIRKLIRKYDKPGVELEVVVSSRRYDNLSTAIQIMLHKTVPDDADVLIANCRVVADPYLVNAFMIQCHKIPMPLIDKFRYC